MPEETKNILSTHGYICECRGEIYVKGKGKMVTYFVKSKMWKSFESANGFLFSNKTTVIKYWKLFIIKKALKITK